MSKFKKITATLAALFMAFGTVAATTACGGEKKVILTVVCKDEMGNPISDVDVEIKYGAKVVGELKTNEKGEAKYTVKKDQTEKDYLVFVDSEDFPEHYYPDSYSWRGAVTQSTSVEFIAEDWTPDGSEEKPFMYVGGDAGEMEQTIPANTTYYYEANKLGGRHLFVENENVEVIYKNNTYEYDEAKGYVEAPVGEGVAPNNPNETRTFAVKNNSDAEITVILNLKNPISDPGTANNPHDLTIGEKETKITVSESGTKATVVYYAWTATTTGELTISSDSNEKYIAVAVDGTTQTLEETSMTVNVTAGQKVTISVSVYIDSDAPLADGEYAISFTTNFEETEMKV